MLAAPGKGRDDRPPDEGAKARLRRQALVWLKAERVAWAEALDSEPKERTRAAARSPVSFWSTDGSKVQEQVSSAMRHRRDDLDLATVREADALAKLPEAERKE